MYEIRREKDNLLLVKPFFAFWKRLHNFRPTKKLYEKKKQCFLDTWSKEGTLVQFLIGLKYLPRKSKSASSTSIHEFIRVHRGGLQKLDPVLYRSKGTKRDELVAYLNDIIFEGFLVVEGGWITCVPRLPPSSTTPSAPLAITDKPAASE